MAIIIKRADITKVKADIIVNSANRHVAYGNGVDRAIYKAAGEDELMAARKLIGEIKPGDVGITRAYKLDAKWIIHAVCPKWIDGDSCEYEMLQGCYEKILELALEKRCTSIAVPLIGTGVFRYPKKSALRIAFDTFVSFLLEHEMTIILVLFSKETVEYVKRIWPHIEEEIYDNDVMELCKDEYVDQNEYSKHLLKPINMEELGDVDPQVKEYYDGIRTVLMQAINNDIEPEFGEIVRKYMKPLYKYDVDFYSTAGIGKQTFYDIKFNRNNNPYKDTVWGICLALRLDKLKVEQLMKASNHNIDLNDERDRVLMDCIERKIYNITEVNIILYEKGLRILGKKRDKDDDLNEK